MPENIAAAHKNKGNNAANTGGVAQAGEDKEESYNLFNKYGDNRGRKISTLQSVIEEIA